MVRVGIQSQRILGDFLKNQATKFGSEPLDPLNLASTFMDLLRGMVADPSAIMEAQFALWRDYMNLWERTARRKPRKVWVSQFGLLRGSSGCR